MEFFRRLLTYFLLLLHPMKCWAASTEILNDGGNSESPFSSTSVIVGVIISIVVTFLVFILVVANCMDCMNSEVSSENHPACSDGSQRKWGGAVDYTPANRNDPNAGFTTGEIVNPADSHNQPLPYSMVPTHVPEEAGFRGYQQAGGLSGYNANIGDNRPAGNYGAQQANLAGYGDVRPTAPNRHVNPLDPDDPPPAYGAQ